MVPRGIALPITPLNAALPPGPSPDRPLKKRSISKAERTLPVIGWREWVGLPDLDIGSIKAKVDTGARSSSLHAFGVKSFERDGSTWVRFEVHPVQRSSAGAFHVEAEVLEFRKVRSSSGKAVRRPVILTRLDMHGSSWPIELTLASRDEMGFRMLLGREAIRGRFQVDPGRSYLGGGRQRTSKDRPTNHDTTDNHQKKGER